TVIVGGYHPSAIPQDFAGMDVDFIIQGEGEITLHELISRDPSERIKIKNQEKSQMPFIMKGKVLKDLDLLPMTDFTIYQPYLKHYNHLSLALSRGCPLSCNFCVEKHFETFRPNGMRWRSYSSERAIKEIFNAIETSNEYLKNNSDKSIGFYDPIFGFNLKWRKKVLETLADAKKGYTFWTETRVDAIKKRDLKLLKDANVNLMLGFESGSPKMLGIMNKTRNPIEYLNNLKRLLLIAKEINYGPLVLNILLNFPGERPSTINETFTFLKDIINENVFFWTAELIYMLFPGDRVFNHLEDWEKRFGTNFYFKSWWRSIDTVKNSSIIDASQYLKYDKAIQLIHKNLISMFKALIDNAPSIQFKFGLMKKIKNENELLKQRSNTLEKLILA
ncbi:MAG: B12-binding domain-containing radical SAM protein, partial [Promethearchaeota archaeon]